MLDSHRPGKRGVRARHIAALTIVLLLIPAVAMASPGSFSSTNATSALTLTNTGTGRALSATSAKSNTALFYAKSTTGTGTTLGAIQKSVTSGAKAISGDAIGATGATYGVYGHSGSGTGFGVYGSDTTSGGYGVFSNGTLGVVAGKTLQCTGCVTTSDLADGSVTSAKILDDNVTSTDILDGTIRFADLNFVPALLSQLLGSVGRPGSLLTPEATNHPATYPSVVLGGDGLPAFAYAYNNDVTNDLWFAHCEDQACVTTSARDVGVGAQPTFINLLVGNNGFPTLVYRNGSDSRIHMLACDTYDCSGTNTDTNTGTDGTNVAATLDSAGVVIVFRNANILEAIVCGACAPTTLVSLDATTGAGQWNSVTVGGDGNPLISEYLIGSPPAAPEAIAQTQNFKIVHCISPNCVGAPDITTYDSQQAAGDQNSITTGTDGLGVAAYYNQTSSTLRLLHCSNAACTSATQSSVGGLGSSFARGNSITIGSDGMPVVSTELLNDGGTPNGFLKVVHCSILDCSASSITNVTTEDPLPDPLSVGPTWITIAADGNPLISYISSDSQKLKNAHCSNPFCTQQWRRR